MIKLFTCLSVFLGTLQSVAASGAAFSYSGSVSMDGSNYLHYPSGVPGSLGADLSVSMWVRTTATTGSLFSLGRTPTNTDGEAVMEITGSGTLRYWEYDDTVGVGLDGYSTVPINTGEWVNIVFVRDGINGHFYINGAPAGDITATNHITYANFDLCFGIDYRDGGNIYLGDVRDISVYSAALSSDDVTNLGNAASCHSKFLRVSLVDNFGDGWQDAYWYLRGPNGDFLQAQASFLEDVTFDIYPCDYTPNSGSYYMTVKTADDSLPEGWWEIYWTVEVLETHENHTHTVSKFVGGFNSSFVFDYDAVTDTWTRLLAEDIPNFGSCEGKENMVCSASKCQKKVGHKHHHGSHGSDSSLGPFEYGERDLPVSIQMYAPDCKKGWTDLTPVGAKWYVADSSLTEIFDQGGLCGGKHRNCEAACEFCLGDGSYVFRVTGPVLEFFEEDLRPVVGKGKGKRRGRKYHHEKREFNAWEFCRAKGGFNEQLHFHVSNGKCFPDELRWVDDLQQPQNSSVHLRGVIALDRSVFQPLNLDDAIALMDVLSNDVEGWSSANMRNVHVYLGSYQSKGLYTYNVEFELNVVAEDYGVDGASYSSVLQLVSDMGSAVSASFQTSRFHEAYADQLSVKDAHLLSLTVDEVQYAQSRLEGYETVSATDNKMSSTMFYSVVVVVAAMAIVGMAFVSRQQGDYNKVSSITDSEHIAAEEQKSVYNKVSSVTDSEHGNI